MSTLKGKNIAIFAFEDRNLISYPPIINFSKVLSNKGCKIDIYAPPPMKTDFKYKNVNVIVTKNFNQNQYVSEVTENIQKNGKTYDLIISYYFEGLLIADCLNKTQYIPTIYFSMELIYSNILIKTIKKLIVPKNIFYENIYHLINILNKFRINILNKHSNEVSNFHFIYMNSIKYVWRIIKFKFSIKKYIKFAIVQDYHRMSVLKKELSFIKKHYILPNSYIGFHSKKSNFAYDNFCIPRNKKILLYIGGIEKGFDIKMIDSIKNLSKDYVLFLNAYSRDGYIDEVVTNYEDLINKRIFINKTILSESKLSKLVSSSYLGLVWYPKPHKNNMNMYYLGLSSGKLCKYLSCGVPVIAPDYFFGYKNIINSKLGYTCEESSDIPNKVLNIASRYKYFQSKIKEYYNKNLDFSSKSIFIVNEIKRIIL